VLGGGDDLKGELESLALAWRNKCVIGANLTEVYIGGGLRRKTKGGLPCFPD